MSASARPPDSRGPCGRFAPTPSGPLHLGSLLAAVGSYLSAKKANGRWLLRIEDLDRNRAIPGVAEQMLQTLESFGFEWDGKVEFQNDRILFYEQALACLEAKGLCYPCRCSRSQLATQLIEPGEELVYPGPAVAILMRTRDRMRCAFVPTPGCPRLASWTACRAR